MSELECLRERYMPEKIRILFVGESPPKARFFYCDEGSRLGKATMEGFERVFQRRFQSYREFLDFFRSQGCYLEDLFHERGKSVRCARMDEVEAAIRRLAKLIAEYKPVAVVAVLNGISKHVEKAVKEAGVSTEVKCLRFPIGAKKDEYIKGLTETLRKLL